MPLLDHFRPPIALHHQWASFHARWAVALADDLNRRLPRRFLAENQVQLGRRVEADVVEFDQEYSREEESGGLFSSNGGGGTVVAVAPEVYAPPAPAMSIAVEFQDAIEVRVYDQARDRRVEGAHAIEIERPTAWLEPDWIMLTTGARLRRSARTACRSPACLAAAISRPARVYAWLRRRCSPRV